MCVLCAGSRVCGVIVTLPGCMCFEVLGGTVIRLLCSCGLRGRCTCQFLCFVFPIRTISTLAAAAKQASGCACPYSYTSVVILLLPTADLLNHNHPPNVVCMVRWVLILSNFACSHQGACEHGAWCASACMAGGSFWCWGVCDQGSLYIYIYISIYVDIYLDIYIHLLSLVYIYISCIYMSLVYMSLVYITLYT